MTSPPCARGSAATDCVRHEQEAPAWTDNHRFNVMNIYMLRGTCGCTRFPKMRMYDKGPLVTLFPMFPSTISRHKRRSMPPQESRLEALTSLLKSVLILLGDSVFSLLFCNGLSPLIYLLTCPLAELWFFHMSQRFIDKQSKAEHGTYTSRDAAEAVRCLKIHIAENPNAVERLLRGWFQGDPSLELRRGNVREFLAFLIFNQPVVACDVSSLHECEQVLAQIEGAIGRPFPRAPRVAWCPCVHAGAVDAGPKPLFVYIGLQVLRQLLDLYLRVSLGFVRMRSGRLDYYCRPAPPSLRRPMPPPPLPIVFLHGVLGPIAYMLLLRELAASHEGEVLVPLFPHCSMEIAHICHALGAKQKPHDATELVAAIRTMLARHNPSPHSPPAPPSSRTRSARLSLLLCCEGHPSSRRRARSSTRSASSSPTAPSCAASSTSSPACARCSRARGCTLARGLVADEPTVQDCFRTCFWWAQHWLHPAEIPCDALVLLSGRDTIAPAGHIHAHLRSWQRRAREWAGRAGRRPRKLEVTMHEKWPHGLLLGRPREIRALISKLKLAALSSSALSPVTRRLAPAAPRATRRASLLAQQHSGGDGASGGGGSADGIWEEPSPVTSPSSSHAASPPSIGSASPMLLPASPGSVGSDGLLGEHLPEILRTPSSDSLVIAARARAAATKAAAENAAAGEASGGEAAALSSLFAHDHQPRAHDVTDGGKSPRMVRFKDSVDVSDEGDESGRAGDTASNASDTMSDGAEPASPIPAPMAEALSRFSASARALVGYGGYGR